MRADGRRLPGWKVWFGSCLPWQDWALPASSGAAGRRSQEIKRSVGIRHGAGGPAGRGRGRQPATNDFTIAMGVRWWVSKTSMLQRQHVWEFSRVTGLVCRSLGWRLDGVQFCALLAEHLPSDTAKKPPRLDDDKFACPDNLSFENINYCMSLCCPGVITAGCSLSLENLQSGWKSSQKSV